MLDVRKAGILLYLCGLKRKEMQIIRIEHPSNGRGMFWNTSIMYKGLDYMLANWYIMHNKMRSARDIEGFTQEYFCAYCSLEEMNQWLTADEISFFISKGFEVLLLEVSDYIIDADQVIYTKKSISESKNINSLFLQKSLEISK